ncbi:MAG: hypothetical protein SNG35_01960 [Rikenellaceae bacterium]
MKKFTILSLLVSLFALTVNAQEEQRVSAKHEAKVEKKAAKGEEYRRSSLCMIMIEDPSMPKKDVIREAFFAAETPSKYNDHNVGKRAFSITDIKVNPDDIRRLAEAEMAGRIAEKMAVDYAATGNAPAAVASSGSINTANVDEVAVKALKFMGDQDLAYELVRKWFFDQSSGKNTMDLVQLRGLVDASAASIADTETALDPKGLLMDAGVDLVNNTFVVASRFKYMSKDELFAEISAISLAVAKELDKRNGNELASLAAKTTLIAVKAAMGDGYFVRSNSFLFQLHWDEEVENSVWNSWDSPADWIANKDKFTLKYIGMEKGWANTKAGIFSNLPEGQLVRAATVNAMNNVLAKLEKRYEVFKTKVPLMVYNPPVPEDSGKKKAPKVEQVLYAKIGVKEGLSGGEKFEVLEAKLDKKTGVTTYSKKGVIKVSKGKVWDNTYNPEKGYDQHVEELAVGEMPKNATYFDGGKASFYEGLLLRQIK